jgi:hypothetical protein
MTMIPALDHHARRRPHPRAIAASLVLAAGWLTGVTGSQAGEARCWIDKGALVASAAFGDIAGDFLIDLATPVSQLHETRAGMAGLTGPSATRTLAIAGQRVPAFTLTITDLDARTARFDTVITGVLGADLWRRFTLEIDPAPACRLRLTRARGGRLAHGLRLPLTTDQGPPLVPAILTDGTHVRAEAVAIGTAQWVTRINGATPSRPIPATGADAPTPVRLRALEVGGRLFEEVPVETSGPDTADGPSVVGYSVWSTWRLHLDIRDGWLDLAPGAHALQADSPERR